MKINLFPTFIIKTLQAMTKTRFKQCTCTISLFNSLFFMFTLDTLSDIVAVLSKQTDNTFFQFTFNMERTTFNLLKIPRASTGVSLRISTKCSTGELSLLSKNFKTIVIYLWCSQSFVSSVIIETSLF